MAELELSDELVTRVRNLAQKQHRTPNDIVTELFDKYEGSHPEEESIDETPENDPLVGLIGLLDDEIQETDLSSTIRETLKEHTYPQYGWAKSDRTD